MRQSVQHQPKTNNGRNLPVNFKKKPDRKQMFDYAAS